MILKKHEIRYLLSFNTSFNITLRENVDGPKDIVNVRVKNESVMVRFAGFYKKDRARKQFGDEDFLFSPGFIEHNDDFADTDFYRIGWFYED